MGQRCSDELTSLQILDVVPSAKTVREREREENELRVGVYAVGE